jgi:hypothetical protein
MSAVFHFLQAQPFVALFSVLAAGMILGRPAIRGISLGSVVCIIFVGLLVSIGAREGLEHQVAVDDGDAPDCGLGGASMLGACRQIGGAERRVLRQGRLAWSCGQLQFGPVRRDRDNVLWSATPVEPLHFWSGQPSVA